MRAAIEETTIRSAGPRSAAASRRFPKARTVLTRPIRFASSIRSRSSASDSSAGEGSITPALATTAAMAELGDFLRTRRARLRPQDVGLPDHGRRRVPGLRREEIAQLAGVSVDYYVRLEQGRDIHPSDQVLDAIANALRLNEDERTHLNALVRPRPR